MIEADRNLQTSEFVYRDDDKCHDCLFYKVKVIKTDRWGLHMSTLPIIAFMLSVEFISIAESGAAAF